MSEARVDWGREAVRNQELIFSIIMTGVAVLSRGNPALRYPDILWAFAALMVFNLTYQLLLRRHGGNWVVPLVSMACNTTLVTLVLHYSGGKESEFWPMYLLPIFTACVYLRAPHVLFATLSSAAFLGIFYIEPIWNQSAWEATEFLAKSGVLGLSAAITGFFATRERRARISLESNRAELDRLAATVARKEEAPRAPQAETPGVPLGTLLEGVLHNLNNGLMVVLGSAEILLEDAGEDPHKRRDLERIANTAHSMGQLTANLLRWSHPDQAGRDADLSAVLNQAAALLDYKLKRRRLTLAKDLQDELPPMPLSTAHLQQAFISVLFLAADRADHGGTLRLKTASTDDEVQVVVSYPTRDGKDPMAGLEPADGIVQALGGRLAAEKTPEAVAIEVHLPIKKASPR